MYLILVEKNVHVCFKHLRDCMAPALSVTSPQMAHAIPQSQNLTHHGALPEFGRKRCSPASLCGKLEQLLVVGLEIPDAGLANLGVLDERDCVMLVVAAWSRSAAATAAATMYVASVTEAASRRRGVRWRNGRVISYVASGATLKLVLSWWMRLCDAAAAWVAVREDWAKTSPPCTGTLPSLFP